MACSSTCPSQDHESFGACMRAKRIQVADIRAHNHNQKLYKQLDNYVDARKSGLQPESVFKKDVDEAWSETERTGTPFRADQIETPTYEA